MSKEIALVDMDGTLCDFNGQLARDMERLRAPEEPTDACLPGGKRPEYLEARERLIKAQRGWWRSLPVLPLGMEIVEELQRLDFDLHVLTKGPYISTNAWTEKVEWCRQHLPRVPVTITEDKGLVYGRVLVDDWPPYIERWLEWRPRGTVIMPAQPWNQSIENPRVLRYDGSAKEVLRARLKEARERG